MDKIIIVGLSNPHSDKSEDALAPYPERSSGWRLGKMTHDILEGEGLALSRYMLGTDRRNLLNHDQLKRQPKYWRKRAQVSALFMVKHTIPKGSTVVVLGHDVRDAFSPCLSQELKRVLLHPQIIDGVIWRFVPHPSGRTHAYNEPSMRALVGMLLADAITEHQQHRRAT